MDFNDFESIINLDENKIVGGFSSSYSNNLDGTVVGGDASNNCLGGNCNHFCGYGQNVQCNAYVGCGN